MWSVPPDVSTYFYTLNQDLNKVQICSGFVIVSITLNVNRAHFIHLL